MIFESFIFSFSAVENKDKYIEKITKFGGKTETDYTNNVTHLIASKACTEKCREARLIETPIIFPEWIDKCIEQKQLLPTDPYKLSPLTGCTISSSGFDSYSKGQISDVINELGGTFVNDFSRRCTHLISQKPEGKKVEHAIKWKIPIVKIDWLYVIKSHGYCYEHEHSFPELASFLDVDSLSQTSTKSIISPTILKSNSLGSEQGSSNFNNLDDLNQEGENDEEEGIFLFENCSFILENFSKEEIFEIDKMLAFMGASRTPFFSQSKETIILINSSFLSNSEVEKYSNMKSDMIVGNLEWLRECYKKREIVAVDDFVKRPKKRNIDSISDSNENKNKKRKTIHHVDTSSFLGLYQQNDMIPSSTPQIKKSKSIKKEEFIKKEEPKIEELISNSKTLKSKINTKTNEENEEKSTLKSIQKIESKTVEMNDIITPTKIQNPISNLFDGMLFNISFVSKDELKLKRLIEKYSGMITSSFDHFIVFPFKIEDDISDKYLGKFITKKWIIDCIESDKVLDLKKKILYQPIVIRNKNKKEVKISTASIHGDEKDDLKEIIEILGGRLISGMDKSTDYLIVRNKENKKYQYAKDNNIPIVIPQWILECGKKGFFVNEFPYLYENTYDIIESQQEIIEQPKPNQKQISNKNEISKNESDDDSFDIEQKKTEQSVKHLSDKEDEILIKGDSIDKNEVIPITKQDNPVESPPKKDSGVNSMDSIVHSQSSCDSWNNAPPPDVLLTTDINSFQNEMKQLIESSGQEESQISPITKASLITPVRKRKYRKKKQEEEILSTQHSKVFQNDIEINEDNSNSELISNPNFIKPVPRGSDINLEKSQIFKYVNKKNNILENDEKLFLLSGFDAENSKASFIEKITSLGGRVTEDYYDDFTHLITTSAKKYSLKLCCALAAGGIWILQPSFIHDSFDEGNWVSEISREWSEEYLPDVNVDMNIVKAIKLRRQSDKKAFENWNIGLGMSDAGIITLLKVGGATVIDLDNDEEIEIMTHLIIDNHSIGSQLSLKIEKWRKINGTFRITKKQEVSSGLTKNLE
eukprot:gene12741-6933_t